MASPALIVMAKRPRPGRAKTRLSPPLSAGQAADLYEAMLRDTLDLARALPGVTPLIAAPPGSNAYFDALAPDLGRLPQQGTGLGQRLHHVLSAALRCGHAAAAALNSDGPTLPRRYLRMAFTRLADPAIDVVLGPCEDGGYYLIGLKRPQPGILCEVQMSTPHVLRDTLDRAVSLGLRVALLPAWYDVDEGDDLLRLQEDLRASSPVAAHTRLFLRDLVRVS